MQKAATIYLGKGSVITERLCTDVKQDFKFFLKRPGGGGRKACPGPGESDRSNHVCLKPIIKFKNDPAI